MKELAKYYFPVEGLNKNYLIFHPFKKIAQSNLGSKEYIGWRAGASIYDLTNNMGDLHIALLHYYFALAKSFGEYTLTTENHFKEAILPICNKLKALPSELMPTPERLDFPLLNKILNMTGLQTFSVESFFGNADGSYSVPAFEIIYSKFPSWKIKSPDGSFYFESFIDDTVSLVAFNSDEFEFKFLKAFDFIDIIDIGTENDLLNVNVELTLYMPYDSEKKKKYNSREIFSVNFVGYPGRYSAMVNFINNSIPIAREKIRALLRFIKNTGVENRIAVGSKLKFFEGGTCIGEGTVL